VGLALAPELDKGFATSATGKFCSEKIYLLNFFATCIFHRNKLQCRGQITRQGKIELDIFPCRLGAECVPCMRIGSFPLGQKIMPISRLQLRGMSLQAQGWIAGARTTTKVLKKR
jgi:hypothetical protein